eukprot:NODE_2573_length_1389_cov_63.312006_g2445_i0.p1 GENE.NODE_2573_length_1389_cov_63.312006_g2445_i0~~NODE_2573_length_1389_cov_63.312006_g2445_i0.p1  ORF type:complete len:301 (-),score=33.25 NODE_2573_length_1389_cov_63.312006_g2445_i0:405-1307(-)
MQEHEDMIHDAQPDYYGRYIASCSSDRTIKIWQVVNGTQSLLTTLRGHDGPVWQVAWGHPKFGSLLASCSYDHKIIIWKEVNKNNWSPVYTCTKHHSSVNSIAWAPHEYGAMLASASSDGHVGVISYDTEAGTWKSSANFKAHAIGCNAVNWAPCHSADGSGAKRLASGGCDNMANVWKYNADQDKWEEEGPLADGHKDWVRDVAFSPNIAVPKSTLATCSQDKDVIFWTKESEDSKWTKSQTINFPEAVWRLSWNVLGTILAVTSADNKVTLLKEHPGGEWKQVSTIDTGNATPPVTSQ